jgi:VWFA-related protein
MIRSRRVCVAAALLALGVPVQGLGDRDPKKGAPEFGSHITIVSLPVFVTDGKGRALAHLTADQFEIEDEGKKVPIVGFREVDAQDALPDEDAEASPAARRQFLLLFDLSFTSVAGLVRARQAARDFVDRGLGPTDLAAVATLSANHGVQLLVGFTEDRSQLRRAVSTLGILKLDRKADPLGLVYDLTEVGSAYADVATAEGPGASRSNVDDTYRQLQIRYQQAERTDYRQRTRGFLQGLAELARSLDGLQGRKQVILLSGGFDATPLQGESTRDAMATGDALTRGRYWEVRSEDRFGDTGLRAELEDALRTFSTSDSVVHTVDVNGLVAQGDARFQSSEPPRGSSQESLARIARLSGGVFFKNTNDAGEIFDDILEMSRHYYLLAFEPAAEKGPGEFHKLKVRLRAKGTRVSHRSGYFERAAYTDRSPLQRQFEASELVAKGITGGALGMKAMAIPYRDASGRVQLPVVLALDGASLLEGAASERVGLELYGYAIDEQGRTVDYLAAASNLPLARLRGAPDVRDVQCHAVFTLTPGRYTLRFLARDGETGRTGSYWLEVNVPSFDAAGVMLFPPIFMEDPQGLVVVRAVSQATSNPVAPFQVASEAFAPSARPQVVNGRVSSVCLLAFDGGERYDPGASFEIRSQLLDASNQPVSAGLELTRSVAGPDGYRRFVMSFKPEALAPGEYTLRVGLLDPASGRLSEAYQNLRVK